MTMPIGWTEGGLWSAPIGSQIKTDVCQHLGGRGKVCGEPITQGVLNPERWFHTARLFDFRAGRPPEPHDAVPQDEEARLVGLEQRRVERQMGTNAGRRRG